MEIFYFVFSLAGNRKGDFLIANFQKIGIAFMRPVQSELKVIFSLNLLQKFSNDRNLPSFEGGRRLVRCFCQTSFCKIKVYH